MDEKVKDAIEKTVKVLVRTGAFIDGVRAGTIPFSKERYELEKKRIEEAKQAIKACEDEGIMLNWERSDVEGVEKELMALINR